METTTTRTPPLRLTRHPVVTRPGIQLQDRDREIMKIVYDYRFITAVMLQDLVAPVTLTERQQAAIAQLRARKQAKQPSDHTASRPKREILRRLQKLYQAGYLDRPRQQPQPSYNGSSSLIYALGNRGADELTLYYGIDRQKVDWSTKNREAGTRYMVHQLMIGNFRHALDLALRNQPETRLHSWEHAGTFKAAVSYEDHKGKERPTTVIPDAYFCLKDRRNGHDDLLYFFLEADRSTMTNDRFLQKLKGYYHFWKYDIFKKPDNSYQLPSFRVLTLTISEARKENLRQLAKTVDDQQRGSGLFWFLCEKQYRTNPTNLLQPLWQTPKDDRLQALLAVG